MPVPIPLSGQAEPVLIQLGLVVEDDLAQSFTVQKRRRLGRPIESDFAYAVRRRKQYGLGLVEETDEALPLGRTLRLELGLAVETDEALPMTVRKTGGLPSDLFSLETIEGIDLGEPVLEGVEIAAASLGEASLK